MKFEIFLGNPKYFQHFVYGNVGVKMNGEKFENRIIYDGDYDSKIGNKICETLAFDSFFSIKSKGHFRIKTKTCFKLKYSTNHTRILL